MSSTNWLGELRSTLNRNSTGRARRSLRTAARRLQIQTFEDRCMPSFSPATSYAAGDLPQAVVTADFNGDEQPDLAVANYYSHDVSVLLGNADGTFEPAIHATTGAGPLSLAVGDFNEDGLLDLASANASDVSILIGNGNGTFDAPANTPVWSSPASVAVGDFNNDGNMDLGVATNYYVPGGWGYWGWYPGYHVGYATVLIGNGAGAVTSIGSTYSGYGFHNGAAAADFNGDGRDDFVTNSLDYGTSIVMLADLNGALGYPASYYAGYYPSDVTAGDVNGDTKVDIVAATDSGVSVLLGNGAGGFANAVPYATGSHSVAVMLGDFNSEGGDGHLDIATANAWGNGLSVLLGAGDGTFRPPLSPASDGNGGTGLAVGDFNGDGWLDAARSTTATQDLEVFLNDETWPALNAPVLTIANATAVTEGHSGTVNAKFTVSLSATSSQPITVAYRTVNSSAVSGSDFQAKSGTLTFTPGDTSEDIEISVLGDRVGESDEVFSVELSDSVNAFVGDSAGIGTIRDDEPTIGLVGDVSVVEGNSGTTLLEFTVKLSGTYDEPVTVHYNTADLIEQEEWWYGPGAEAGSDYISTSGTVTIDAGTTSAKIPVLVKGDLAAEANEPFWMKIGNADYADIGTSQVLGTILDDEPYLSVEYAGSVVEGNTGTKQLTFKVTVDGTIGGPVTVDYSTADGSAVAGSDYQVTTGTLTFGVGDTSKEIKVTVNGDQVAEYDEYLYMVLSNPTGAGITNNYGSGTIEDDEPRISIDSPAPITEGNTGQKPLIFTISLSRSYDYPVTVNYATFNDTALAGSDYVAKSGTVTFAPGDTSETISVMIIGDRRKENDEYFTVQLSNPSVNAMVWDGYGLGVIDNDDGKKK